jgi:hypothetical protein
MILIVLFAVLLLISFCIAIYDCTSAGDVLLTGAFLVPCSTISLTYYGFGYPFWTTIAVMVILVVLLGRK